MQLVPGAGELEDNQESSYVKQDMRGTTQLVNSGGTGENVRI